MKLFLIVLFTLLFSSCSDTVTSHYDTYHEALNDRLFDRGWLPDILPMSTTNISTNNDLDLNSSSGKFTIPEKDMEFFKKNLESIEFGVFSYGHGSTDHYWVFTVHEGGNVSYVLKSN